MKEREPKNTSQFCLNGNDFKDHSNDSEMQENSSKCIVEASYKEDS
jgi:hypothetical protein